MRPTLMLINAYACRLRRRIHSVLQQLAGGDGELYGVGGYAGWIRACGDFRAAAAERFELPVIECCAGDRYVVAAIAVLAFRERLDDLRRRKLVGDGREVQRVAAGDIAA